MALSAKDKLYYEEKLGLGTFVYLFCWTLFIGAVMWPLLIYIQDCSNGLASQWTFKVAFDWAFIGLMLGSVVAVMMYLGFKFLLEMGWLPSRDEG